MTNLTEYGFRKRAVGDSSTIVRRKYGWASHVDAHCKANSGTSSCTEKANRKRRTCAHQAKDAEMGVDENKRTMLVS